MKWGLSRCRRKYVSGRYEVQPTPSGRWKAIWNPWMKPGTNTGMYCGGRMPLGLYATVPEAKSACEAHARKAA